MDHHSHNRHGTARHRQGAGIRRGMDCRSNNIGSLFRRQDFAAVRHDSAGIVNNGHKAVYPHTLYAHNHRAVDNNHSRHIYRCRTCHEPQRQRAERAFAGTLAQTFNLSPWLLLVPVITACLILAKLPTIITLFISSVIAGICILLFQPHILLQIVDGSVLDFATGFKALMTSIFGSTSISTGHAEIDALVATRGMRGMMDTIWLIICAMCFGGVMSASNMISSITNLFVRFVRKPASAVCSTVGAGLFFNTCTADQYLSIILTGNLFKDLYQSRRLESRLLSRTVEDSVTVTSVLIPWNSCGMTQATVLGVGTLTYLPYCFFNILSPLMSILVAFTGFKIKQIITQPKEENITKVA